MPKNNPQGYYKQPAKPGRRVGRNPLPGTPRKVGRYTPPRRK